MQTSVIATSVVGWCLFVTSFFLPAFLGSPGQSGHFFGGTPAIPPMQGWQAAYAALIVFPWWGLTNLAMLASPLFFVIRTPSRRRIIVYVLCASSLLDVLPYVVYGSMLTVGYFLWCGSFLLVTFAFYWAQRIDFSGKTVGLICALAAMVLATEAILNVADQQPLATGRSKSWSVSVHRSSYAYYSEEHYNLVLYLQFEYVGPAGEIAAPAIAVVDEKGRKYTPPSLNFGATVTDERLSLWLDSSAMPEQTRRSLKPGEKFGGESPLGYGFLAVMPTAPKKLKLVFGDVPPIVFNSPHRE